MSWKTNRLTKLLDIKVPIIQAPMAGASTPEMVVASGDAGALGSLGCALQTKPKIRADVAKVRKSCKHSFNMNFFTHERPAMDQAKIALAKDRLTGWYERLDAGEPVAPQEATLPFDSALCTLVVKAAPKVVSFHFGLPSAKLVERLLDAGIVVLSSATSVKEAVWLAERGVSAVIAQGYEAGGHSGWFLDRKGSEVAGTMALVPRIVDAVDVPVIAAGGITDGRGIAAAMMLGAEGVQIGTAFLTSPECSISEVHKQAILDASGDDTVCSKAFSGRAARTIVNEYALDTANDADWPDFPLMNAATAALRKASADQDLPDAVSLWSGQAVGLVKDRRGVQQAITDLVQDADKLLT